MVFQSYALYPHMTVAREHRLRPEGAEDAEGRDRREACRAPRKILELTELLGASPRSFPAASASASRWGARSCASPTAFLMDEPLSNLDARLRVQMRAEIARLQRDLGVTTIYVTHDQIEAMTMGDRVAVMRRGELQQVDHPQVLYDHPVNLFVGGFIGSPAMNMVEATLEQRNGGFAARLGDQSLAVSPETLGARPGLAAYAGRTVVVGIRPEDLEDASLVSRRARGPAARTEVSS